LLVEPIVRPKYIEFNLSANQALLSAALVLPTIQPDLKLSHSHTLPPGMQSVKRCMRRPRCAWATTITSSEASSNWPSPVQQMTNGPGEGIPKVSDTHRLSLGGTFRVPA
jgi:hypothetical protein